MAIDKNLSRRIFTPVRAGGLGDACGYACTATVSTRTTTWMGRLPCWRTPAGSIPMGTASGEGRNGAFLYITYLYGVYDNMVLFFQSSMAELGIEIKTNPIDLMAFMQQVFMEDNYEMTAYMSYWFPYDPYTFVANMYPSTDYTDPSGIYSTDPQVAKALAIMSDEDAKKLIGGLYNTDDPVVVQKIYTTALDSANESSVVIPLNYRNEYAVFNNEVIESYTFNSIPNHVDVAAIHLK
ncbi:MAG: hypothetical protein ACLSB9_31565 [Hydrogeniiclostridium mannosilyticum]